MYSYHYFRCRYAADAHPSISNWSYVKHHAIKRGATIYDQ